MAQSTTSSIPAISNKKLEDSVQPKLPDLTLERSVELEQFLATSFKSRVDLGAIEKGKTALIRLKVTNPSESSISYNSSSMSCNCLSVEPKTGVLEPNKPFDLMLVLRTSTSPSQPTAKYSLQLRGNSVVPATNMRFSFYYEIKNFLSVEHPVFVGVQKNEEIKTFTFPIVLTQPIKVGNLLAKGEGELQDVVFSVEEVKGQPALKMTVPQELLSEGTLAGTFRLTESVSGDEYSSVLSVRSIDDVSISPRTLRFRKSDASDDEYVANAVIRVNLPASEDEASQVYKSGVQASASIEASESEASAKVVLKPLGSKNYRATITLSGVKNKEDFSTLNWRFLSKGNVDLQFASKAIFLD